MTLKRRTNVYMSEFLSVSIGIRELMCCKMFFRDKPRVGGNMLAMTMTANCFWVAGSARGKKNGEVWEAEKRLLSFAPSLP